jgi:hypothetical protein
LDAESNKGTAYLYKIGTLFDIPTNEIRAILPEIEIDFQPNEIMCGESSVPTSNRLTTNNLTKFDEQNKKSAFFDGLDFQPPKVNVGYVCNIPEEYANDPELWYAI